MDGQAVETVVIAGRSETVKMFAEHLQARMEWLDKLKQQRADLNTEIKDTEKAIRKAIDDAADAQVELPIQKSTFGVSSR